MIDLDVSNLIDEVDESKVSEFVESIDSNMRVQTDYKKDSFDSKWLALFEFTLPYIEKIFRNPKRFITNEEEIIKIESAKKVGVESIKHLAKHTNFIQDIDNDTGDVIPSKLLNVFKEETFNTYENRFAYTLLKYMIQFVVGKIDKSNRDPRLRDNKTIDYTSTTKVGDERICVNISLNTTLDTELNKDPHYANRIKKMLANLRELQSTEVYKSLEKEDVPLVTNPIKKTNVILKNVNFQYAMKLWEYINTHLGDKDETEEINKDYQEEGHLKKLIDETFLLEYLTIDSLSNRGNDRDIQKVKEQTVSRMLDKLIDLNPEMTKKQLQEKLGERFEKVKERRATSKKDIEDIFRKYIDKYLKQVVEITL